MSASGSPPSAAPQVKRAPVASRARSSPALSPPLASASAGRASQELWSTTRPSYRSRPSSDNSRTQTSVPDTSSSLSQSSDFAPSLSTRLSGISETSSLESASAEFDGDISIAAPLGQEENTDLDSIHSLVIPLSRVPTDTDLTFSEASRELPTLKKPALIDKQKSLSNSSSLEERLQSDLLPSPTISIKLLLNPHQQRIQQYRSQIRKSDERITLTNNIDKPEPGPSISQPRSLQKRGSREYQSLRDYLKPNPARNRRLKHQQVQEQGQVQERQSVRSATTGTRKRNLRSTATTSSNCPPRMATSLEDITSLRLWKGVVAEFLGTLLLTLVGCGSCVNLRGDTNVTSPVVQIALCFGLSVATVVWAIAHVSGGHVNPAVTCAMLATRKISLVKAILFIVFQLVGATVGAGILYGLTPSDYIGNLGCTLVSDKITASQGLGVELFVTFVLVFVVFASCDGKRKDLNGSAPLTIGLSVTMCHLWAIDYTGSSMNTARSFGPALIKGNWDDHWVYWAGPIVGGVVAGLLYEHLFAVNASITKVKACMLASDYDDEKYRAKKLKVRIIEEENELESPTGLDDNGSYPLTEKDPSAA